jgi:hypothetical protein
MAAQESVLIALPRPLMARGGAPAVEGEAALVAAQSRKPTKWTPRAASHLRSLEGMVLVATAAYFLMGLLGILI